MGYREKQTTIYSVYHFESYRNWVLYKIGKAIYRRIKSEELEIRNGLFNQKDYSVSANSSPEPSEFRPRRVTSTSR